MHASAIRSRRLLAVLGAGWLVASAAFGAASGISAKIEPAEISLGEAASFTISAAGSEAPQISPPMVAGLQFSAVGQSQRIETFNGVTKSVTSVTYQVVAQQPGIYTIPATASGGQPLILKVNPGTSGVRPPSGASAAHATDDETAFVRLRLSKHELYVGESVPVEIQVGTHDGLVASLNGLPTLNGDAFTLAPLSGEPEQRSEELVGGKPYTVFTWRSSLSAVKPGTLSFTMETPLTVRVRTRRPANGPFGDSGFSGLFNNPAFQNFFGGTTTREITVASAPKTFTVLELPTQGRPEGFSGAVGEFKIKSELADPQVTAGDPVTLRLQVSGEGNFDRVNSPMLRDVDHWKTYKATSKYVAADKTTGRGEKTFEQPLIATASGEQTLPSLTFSFFNPETHRYEVARTPPLSVDVKPAAGNVAATGASTSVPVTTPAAAAEPQTDGLRPDHALTGSGAHSLVPIYFEPLFLALPAVTVLAFPGLWFWLRRREHLATGCDSRRQAEPLESSRLLGEMERAAATGDARNFFVAARTVVQSSLAKRWHIGAADVTLGEIGRRVGAGSDVLRMFEVADEAIYSVHSMEATDFKSWQQIVLREISEETTS